MKPRCYREFCCNEATHRIALENLSGNRHKAPILWGWCDQHADEAPEHTGPFCECGAPVDIGGPLEDAHFVFAGRADGSRSNLGYCPVKHGKAEAIRRARWELGTGLAIFHGKAI